jgi:ribose transport system substrate-binding protein
VAVAAVAAGLPLAAMGATSGVSEAKRLLAKDEAPPKSPPKLSPIKVGSSLNGKTIFYVSSGLTFPFSQEVVKGVKDAAKVVGARVTVVDSAGDPSKASSFIDQAVSRKAVAIVLQGTDPFAVSAAVKSAKAARIPVISVAALNAGPVPAQLRSSGLSANVSFDYLDVGRRLARFVVADSNGQANVATISSSTFRISAGTVTTFTKELTRLCPDCKSTVKDSPLPQWQTGLGPLARTIVTSDPGVNYMFPIVDAMALFVKPALAAASAQSKVRIVSQNASQADIKAIAKGDDPEVANVGGPNEWLGWGTVDQIARLALKKPPARTEGVPNRTFDRKNIGSINVNKKSTWYGSLDFRAFYRELWGF